MTQERPIYETNKTKTREQLFCNDLASLWCVDMQELSMYHKIDRLCFKEHQQDAVAALEVKCLNKKSDQCEHYGDTYLNLDKYLTLLEYEKIGVPAIYAIRLKDGDFYCRLDANKHPKVRITGRKDRNDDQDIRPVVRLLWDWFKKIEKQK